MKTSFLVTLYYTLASIIGLILTVIGAAMFVNLMVTTYVLRIPRYPVMPPQPYESAPTQVKEIEARQTLTEEDRKALQDWRTSYAQWDKEQRVYDQQDVEKKRQLATSLSLLTVGLPVLFFHQKELRKVRK